ncbi:snoaL-like domain-containing protein [Pochonia chlamydosporia 170]|uniref:SnoaL-like domain-containing protein n=1 Tax=Pochonia chlamydosporia 170 TaxID=1380566 RepID=A0A179EVX1_METCM|nr:snoaL-like domain-containing protein [Pochonia chlamydosporia 170]OAQ57364.1 snoaL-like domain-containing protein [Pochonia chlamydosporia 170]
MYHYFLKRRLRFVLRKLNAHDYEFIASEFHLNAEHWFAGSHAMSGKRVTHARIVDWYRRLRVVFPGIKFRLHKVFVSGSPWNSKACIEWTDEVYDNTGRPLPNEGVFVISIKWGRVTEFHVYCDTAKIEDNLGILAAQGVSEASAAPIVG